MKTIDELGISPTPWSVNNYVSVCDRYAAIICGQYGPYNWANARLVAAAPELYEALKMLLELCESFGCDKNCRDCGCAESEIMVKAKDALAKASGEEASK